MVKASEIEFFGAFLLLFFSYHITSVKTLYLVLHIRIGRLKKRVRFGWDLQKIEGYIMRDFAEGFYKSKAWQHTRESYFKKCGGLCENCLKKGIYRPAEIIHHKEHIEPWNIDNPEITLSFNNLIALCRQCHANEHRELYKKNSKRFVVNELGDIIFK